MKPWNKEERTILIVDCMSFYASCEKVAHPEYRDLPLAVADPLRRSSIILAACPLAKKHGVTTAMRVNEALAECPDLVIIRPRIQRYITISLLIIQILETFSDLVEPFSCDEAYVDITSSIKLFGNAEEIARQIQHKVFLFTNVKIRVGIGNTKAMAKMALDNFAKNEKIAPEGIFKLDFYNIRELLWPLPINKLFMVASRMTRRFVNRRILTIGDIAQMELSDFKKLMRSIMGKQSDIQAEYYWQTANCIDPSPVEPRMSGKPQSVGNGKTLRASLYTKLKDIEIVLLELCIEVCRRARQLNCIGRAVMLSFAETDGQTMQYYNRRITLQRSTYLTTEVFQAAQKLLVNNWGEMPVAHIAVTLSDLNENDIQQLDLFEDIEKKIKLEKSIDKIKDRYGEAAVIRASSLKATGVARERAEQIGGHYK